MCPLSYFVSRPESTSFLSPTCLRKSERGSRFSKLRLCDTRSATLCDCASARRASCAEPSASLWSAIRLRYTHAGGSLESIMRRSVRSDLRESAASSAAERTRGKNIFPRFDSIALSPKSRESPVSDAKNTDAAAIMAILPRVVQSALSQSSRQTSACACR